MKTENSKGVPTQFAIEFLTSMVKAASIAGSQDMYPPGADIYTKRDRDLERLREK